MRNYTKWESFKFKGRRFLALYNSDGVHIKGERFENYGSYFSIDDFKSHYREIGPENLILKKVTTIKITKTGKGFALYGNNPDTKKWFERWYSSEAQAIKFCEKRSWGYDLGRPRPLKKR